MASRVPMQRLLLLVVALVGLVVAAVATSTPSFPASPLIFGGETDVLDADDVAKEPSDVKFRFASTRQQRLSPRSDDILAQTNKALDSVSAGTKQALDSMSVSGAWAGVKADGNAPVAPSVTLAAGPDTISASPALDPQQSSGAGGSGGIDVTKVDLSTIVRECPRQACNGSSATCPHANGICCSDGKTCCPATATCLSTNPPTCVHDMPDSRHQCAIEQCAAGFKCQHEGIRDCCRGGQTCCPRGYKCDPLQPTKCLKITNMRELAQQAARIAENFPTDSNKAAATHLAASARSMPSQLHGMGYMMSAINDTLADQVVLHASPWNPAQGLLLAPASSVPDKDAEATTYMFWVRPRRASDRWAALFHKGGKNVDRNPAVFMWPRQLRLVVYTGTQKNWNERLTADRDLAENEWTHVAFTHGNGRARLYYNAELVHWHPSDRPASNDADLLGYSPFYPDVANVTLADLRFLPREASVDEIRTVFALGNRGQASDEQAERELASKMMSKEERLATESAAQEAAEIARRKQEADRREELEKAEGTTYTLQDGKATGQTDAPDMKPAAGARFSGDGGVLPRKSVAKGRPVPCFSAVDDASLDFGAESFTVSARVRTSDSRQRWAVVVSKSAGSPGKSDGFFLMLDAGRAVVQLSAQERVVGRKAVADNRWHDLVLVRNASDRTLKLFVDGRLDGLLNTSGGVRNVDNDAALTVGCWSSSQNSLNGGVRDVRTWKRALGPNEIAGL